MKTILIKPCWSYPVDPGDSTYNRNWPPLSLLNCAALMRREGLDADVLDANAERLSPDETANRTEGYDRVFVTSASLDRWQCPNLRIDSFLKTVHAIRKKNVSLHVMGTHGTVRSRQILDITGAQTVICGEPEDTVLDITRGLDLEDIPGIVFYRNGSFIRNPPREPLDLAQLPVPAYDLVDIGQYCYEVMGDRFALLEASRGCPFQCIFCVKSMYGNGFRVKPAARFIQEIDALIDEFRARNIYFIDLEFTVNRKLVENVCDHLIKRGSPVKWCCQTRTDSVDTELLKHMKKAGCQIVHFGVETGSERIRQTLKKGITARQVIEGMKAAREAGIQTVCFFLFGLPTETREEMEETIRFAKVLNPTYASFHIALPYPGTEFYDMVQDELGTELLPPAYTGMVSYETLEKITRRAFRSYYMRPRYIAGRLKDRDFSTFFRQAKFFMVYLKNRLWS
ncbi:radical SAM protein [bacterium]|nr:radical SAM protein [candidate division CSSED10-310 bacterium]